MVYIINKKFEIYINKKKKLKLINIIFK